jgi:hypothetical protein
MLETEPKTAVQVHEISMEIICPEEEWIFLEDSVFEYDADGDDDDDDDTALKVKPK